MKVFTRPTFSIPKIDHGQANGYIIIPKDHPMHGKDYGDINIYAHGGLTFSEAASELGWEEILEEDKEGWVVGFDTMHHGDTSAYWTFERVKQEAENIARQLDLITENSH